MSLPDPNTTTRRGLTQYLLGQQWPEGLGPHYHKLLNGLKRVFSLLAAHEGMRANLDQPYMTPVADTRDKNQVYFMFDLIGSTLGMVPAIPAADASGGMGCFQQVLIFQTMVHNARLAESLIRDTTGRLDEQIQRVHGSGLGYRPNVGFGPEIIEALDEADFEFARQ